MKNTVKSLTSGFTEQWLKARLNASSAGAMGHSQKNIYGVLDQGELLLLLLGVFLCIFMLL